MTAGQWTTIGERRWGLVPAHSASPAPEPPTTDGWYGGGIEYWSYTDFDAAGHIVYDGGFDGDGGPDFRVGANGERIELVMIGDEPDYDLDALDDDTPTAPVVPIRSVMPKDGAFGWEPLDLTALLDGTIEPVVPTVGAFENDETTGALFYDGMVNGIAGESGSGKSWTALYVCAQEIAAGRTVLYVDLEDTPAGLVGRLLTLGVDRSALHARFIYLSPFGPAKPDALDGLARLVKDRAVSFAVIDSSGEALSLQGANPNADDEVAAFFRTVPRRLADAGPAVLVLDHLPKTRARGVLPTPIGSQRKKAAINGVQYVQEVGRSFSRTEKGYARLTCAKDRHGTYAVGEHVALLDVTPEQTNPISLRGLVGESAPRGRTLEERKADQIVRLMVNITKVAKAADESGEGPLKSGAAVKRALKAAGVSFSQNEVSGDLLKSMVGDGFLSPEFGFTKLYGLGPDFT